MSFKNKLVQLYIELNVKWKLWKMDQQSPPRLRRRSATMPANLARSMQPKRKNVCIRQSSFPIEVTHRCQQQQFRKPLALSPINEI